MTVYVIRGEEICNMDIEGRPIAQNAIFAGYPRIPSLMHTYL